MDNHAHSKPFLLISFLVIIVGLFFLFKLEKPIPVPYRVLDSSQLGVYEEGTTVSLYRRAPAGFPEEIILEDNHLNHSSQVTAPDGSIKSSVSYISRKSMSELETLYKDGLAKRGWAMLIHSSTDRVFVAEITKRGEKILLTFAPLKDRVLVTFQQEK